MTARRMDFASYYGPNQRDSISADFTELALGDFGAGSVPSPTSTSFPLNTYQLPQSADWMNWTGKAALSPDFPSTESFDSPIISARFTSSMSPAINPLELAKRDVDSIGGFVEGAFDDLETPLFDNIEMIPDPVTNKSRKTTSTSTAASRTSAHQPLSPISTDESRYPSRKRKSLASTSGSATSSARSSLSPPSPPPAAVPTRRTSGGSTTQPVQPKKTAHNMIEKRYRNNLNDKIAALRDAVPSLRVAAYKLEHGHLPDDAELDEDLAEELGGLVPAQKLNKATILSKAAEYIMHLERRNKELADENAQLKDRADSGIVSGLEGMWR